MNKKSKKIPEKFCEAIKPLLKSSNQQFEINTPYGQFEVKITPLNNNLESKIKSSPKNKSTLAKEIKNYYKNMPSEEKELLNLGIND